MLHTYIEHLEKKVRNGGYFWHADKRQSFYRLVLSFLMEVAIHVQITKNRKLVIFLEHIKKKLSLLLCVLLWCKTFRYFMGVQSCSSLLFTNDFFVTHWPGEAEKLQLLATVLLETLHKMVNSCNFIDVHLMTFDANSTSIWSPYF